MELPKETSKILSQIRGQDKKTKETSHHEGAPGDKARDKQHHKKNKKKKQKKQLEEKTKSTSKIIKSKEKP